MNLESTMHDDANLPPFDKEDEDDSDMHVSFGNSL